jgi:O-antigen biosynthesis protein
MALENHALAARILEHDLGDLAADREASGVSTATKFISIVIPCFGQLEYTQLCVSSVLRYARQPYELIFVDVASLDGTAEYVAGLRAAASVRVELVQTNEDFGIAEAFDIGFARTNGKFVVLLSNDTIVTAGWLNQLTALASSDRGIGAVGPMCNYANPPQLVKGVPYRLSLRMAKPEAREDALDEFARNWRDQTKGKWFETSRLDTFCILFKRETLEKIGPLASLPSAVNPRTRLKVMDESALASAIHRAGWTMACCHDLFIHHFGSRTAVYSPAELPTALR